MSERPKILGVTYKKGDYQPNTPEIDLSKLKAPAKITERPVPTVWRHVVQFEWLRTFTFMERVGLLFGSNFVIAIGVATQHNPGQIQPMVLGKVTPETSASDYMKSVVSNMVEAQAPKTPEAQAAAFNREQNENQRPKEK